MIRPVLANLTDLLREWADDTPDAPAIVDLRSARVHVAELEESSQELATRLDNLDAEAGLVISRLPNCPAAAKAAFGVLRSRHTLLMVHPSLPEYICTETFDRYRPVAELDIDESGDVAMVALRFEGSSLPIWRAPEAAPHLRPALCVLTSGTTGRPRLITAPERQVATAAQVIQARLTYSPTDIVAVMSPLSFDYGLYQLLLALQGRSTVVLDPHLNSVSGLFMAIQRTGATLLPLVPPLLRAAADSRFLSRVDTSLVRLITTTGDLLTESDVVAAAKAFPCAEIRPMYGLSECKRVAVTPPGVSRPAGSVGMPLPGTDAAIVGKDGGRLAAGSVGELVVAGHHLTLGYLRDDAATARRFRVDRRNGVRLLATGDRLWQDGSGWLYWVGRGNDMIKTSGFRIDPAELETAALSTGLVHEAGAYGRPDSLRGQVPVLVVRLREAGQVELTEQLAQRLPSWAMPELECRNSELPRNVNGKIDRQALQAVGRPPVSTEPTRGENQPTSMSPLLTAVARLPRLRSQIACHVQALLSAHTFSAGLTASVVELATTAPFGVRVVPEDPTRLLIPFLDPDLGLDRAAMILGLTVETGWFDVGDAETAVASLNDWLQTGPVVLGPLDLGRLPHGALAHTLRGCDHYLTVLGRAASGDLVIVDPEGWVQVEVAKTDLMAAWAADAVPEGRGAYVLRRLRAGESGEVRADPPSDLFERIAAFALENLAAADTHATGGARGLRLLADLAPSPTERRSLSILLPSAAARYRLAATFAHSGRPRMPETEWAKLGILLDDQVATLATAHGDLLAGRFSSSPYRRAADVEESLTDLAIRLEEASV